jgi:glucokinase
MQADGLTLVADIGGTNARFALTASDAQLQCIGVLACANYAQIDDALEAYLAQLPLDKRGAVDSICMAVAAPTGPDKIKLTNHVWAFSQCALATKFKVPIRVINDFSAQAWCLTSLSDEDVTWLQDPCKDRGEDTRTDLATWTDGTRTITGPGTGFGGASITISLDVLESEPGHLAFAPLDALQLRMLEQLWQWFPRISVEHLLSGPGLANIHKALTHMRGSPSSEQIDAARIVASAKRGNDQAMESIKMFITILGSVCGDMALSVGSRGGLFISGDMLKKMGDLFDYSVFMQAFVDKGSFRQWCQSIPVAVFEVSNPGLRGCALFAARWRGGDTALSNHVHNLVRRSVLFAP